MNIDPRDQFLKETTEVLAGLNEALELVRKKKDEKLKAQRGTQRTWQEFLQQCTEDALPNLEAETLQVLEQSEHFRGFVDHSVRQVFEQAATVKVPFLTRIIGGGAAYRQTQTQGSLEMLRTRLAAAIDQSQITLQASAGQRVDIIRSLMLEVAGQVRSLTEQERDLEEQIQSLTEVQQRIRRKPTLEVPAEIAQRVTNQATRLRGISSQPSPSARREYWRREVDPQPIPVVYQDDDTDLFLLWAFDTPTSLRTVIMHEFLGHDHSHHADVVPAPMPDAAGDDPAGNLQRDDGGGDSSKPADGMGVDENAQQPDGDGQGVQAGTEEQGSFS